MVALTPDLTGRFSAVTLVRIGAEKLGGKGGGGRPDMAQAGGPDGAAAEAALDAVAAALQSYSAAQPPDRAAAKPPAGTNPAAVPVGTTADAALIRSGSGLGELQWVICCIGRSFCW